ATEEAAHLVAVEPERERQARATAQIERGAEPRPRSRGRAVLGEGGRRDGMTRVLECDAARDRAELGRAFVCVAGREAELDLALDQLGAREAGLQVEERRRVREAEEGRGVAESEASARRRVPAGASRRVPQAFAGEE